MSETEKPLELSIYGQTLVPFYDMPEEYVIINRADASQHDGAQQIFNENPSAETLMILYGDQDLDHMCETPIRSVYQSPESFDDNLRQFPEDSHDSLRHVSGEKLIKLRAVVACDLSAYGRANVMVPQLAKEDEIRRMAATRVASISSRDDPFGFAEDWGSTEGLRINRLEESRNINLVKDSGKENTIIAMDIPVEFNASRSGAEVLHMLKSAERGVTIPSEVFMLAAALQGQKDGANFKPEFISKMERSAMAASLLEVYEHMDRKTPLQHPLMVLTSQANSETDVGSESYEIAKYRSGSVLRGDPKCPNEYKVFQNEMDKKRFVLAGAMSKDEQIDGHVGEDWYIKKGTMHVIETDFSSSYMQPEEFDRSFILVTDQNMLKHFGYNPAPDNEPETPSQSTGITPY